MAEPDFSQLPLKELKEMQNKLSGFVEKRLEAKKKKALAEIKKIVKEHDLSFDEVVQTIRAHTKRGKAPAIWRNPENPRQTWSGKGPEPKWYTDAPDKEALRIPGS